MSKLLHVTTSPRCWVPPRYLRQPFLPVELCPATPATITTATANDVSATHNTQKLDILEAPPIGHPLHMTWVSHRCQSHLLRSGGDASRFGGLSAIKNTDLEARESWRFLFLSSSWKSFVTLQKDLPLVRAIPIIVPRFVDQ